ncbi:MAG TPA: tetratricopeptide repeat protein [Polyangiaceae bacterium]|nr:tetratricopeptide repeat protein [Polyangiaceae bacterium]
MRFYALLSWSLLVGSDAACLLFLIGCASAWVAAAFAALHVVLAVAIGLAAPLVAEDTRPVAMRRTQLLVGALSCFVPVIGPVGLLAALGAARPHRDTAGSGWVTLASLDDSDARLEMATASPENNPGFSSVSALLLDRRPEALDRRLGWLLGSRKLPARDAVALLKLALSDPADEVRLFAFTRLERWRNDLEADVKRLQAALAVAGDTGARLHLGLAEAYWELAYFGLVEGAVRDHALFAALQSVDRACAANASDAPARFLRGRILMQRGEYEEARQAFEEALRLKHPPLKVLPYLAECAFEERNFNLVRAVIRTFNEHAPGHAALHSVVDFWR